MMYTDWGNHTLTKGYVQTLTHIDFDLDGKVLFIRAMKDIDSWMIMIDNFKVLKKGVFWINLNFKTILKSLNFESLRTLIKL